MPVVIGVTHEDAAVSKLHREQTMTQSVASVRVQDHIMNAGLQCGHVRRRAGLCHARLGVAFGTLLERGDALHRIHPARLDGRVHPARRRTAHERSVLSP